MTPKLPALGVHLFTALGAVAALLAMLAATEGRWSEMFLWLVAALVIDGIDGPLARRFHVKTQWPRIDGETLDLIIDYLTYVFIPVFALFSAGLLPDGAGLAVILGVAFASALYFADRRMKSPDNSFCGFPACWNMVALVSFALTPPAWVILALMIALAVAMFCPLKFVHPLRTQRWRGLTMVAALVWTAAAALAALEGFGQPAWISAALLGTSIYLLLAGIMQQIVPARGGPGDPR